MKFSIKIMIIVLMMFGLFGLKNLNSITLNMFNSLRTKSPDWALYVIPKNSDVYKKIIQRNLKFDFAGLKNSYSFIINRNSMRDNQDLLLPKAFNYWMGIDPLEEKIINFGDNCIGWCHEYSGKGCKEFYLFCEDIYFYFDGHAPLVFPEKYPTQNIEGTKLKDVSELRQKQTKLKVANPANPTSCKDVTRATYGAGNKQKDVTDIVKKEGLEKIYLKEMNKVFDIDPAPKEEKILRIECAEKDKDGKPIVLEFKEDWTLVTK